MDYRGTKNRSLAKWERPWGKENAEEAPCFPDDKGLPAPRNILAFCHKHRRKKLYKKTNGLEQLFSSPTSGELFSLILSNKHAFGH